MSQTKGRKESKESDAVQLNEDSNGMLDTQPGVPELDLKQTLPTGAAFHATWRMQSLTPNSLPIETQESGVHTLRDGNERDEIPTVRVDSVQPAPATRSQPTGPTRRPRALLAQTLQMPLTVTPIPPDEADSFRSRPASKRPTSSAPPGWQSVQRIGGDDSTVDVTDSRPAPKRAAVGTDPMHASPQPGARSVPPPLPNNRGGFRPPNAPNGPNGLHGADGEPEPMGRHSDFNRTTLSGNVVRVPELSTREWMFIGLLLCASAATLYSLLVDDVTPAVEEDLEAATTIEHVVTPANGQPRENSPNSANSASNLNNVNAAAAAPAAAAATQPAAPKPAAPTAQPTPTAIPPQPAAAVDKTTEIITDPPEAELLLGGAVVGNTPAKVGRSQLTTDYLLRKVGYEPQVVRVSPTSPDTITVTLHSRNAEPPK